MAHSSVIKHRVGSPVDCHPSAQCHVSEPASVAGDPGQRATWPGPHSHTKSTQSPAGTAPLGPAACAFVGEAGTRRRLPGGTRPGPILTIFLWVSWSGPHRRSETTRWDTGRQGEAGSHRAAPCADTEARRAAPPARPQGACRPLPPTSSPASCTSTPLGMPRHSRLGCHSRSSPRRTPGGTGSTWARSGPRACPARQRGARTGWCR